MILPLPPSKNASHDNNGRGGKILSAATRAFRTHVKFLATTALHGRIFTGPVRMEVDVYFPNGRYDCANMVDQFMDGMQFARVLVNDRQAKDFRFREMRERVKHGKVVATIVALPA